MDKVAGGKDLMSIFLVALSCLSVKVPGLKRVYVVVGKNPLLLAFNDSPNVTRLSRQNQCHFVQPHC